MMAFATLIGVLLMIIAQFVEIKFWHGLIEHLGTAFFIASILGWTIDFWLKKQITEDVFSAAMGYELPDDLKREVRYVYGNRVICEDHVQTVSIDELDNGYVRLTVGTERKLRNIGETSQYLDVSLGVDEWGVPGHPSEIIELAYEQSGKSHTIYPGDTAEINSAPDALLAKIEPPLTLRPNEVMTVFAKFSETKPVNSEHFYAFRYATLNPRVAVRVPPGYKWMVSFAHRDEPYPGHYSDITRLDGLLLPHQSIRVRWWRESPQSQ